MEMIGIHLDLKGMNFCQDYLVQYLDDIRKQGINTVLIEYEDMFPFKNIDIAYDRESIWTEETLKLFQRQAQKNNIKIIPLQQCLGHLQYLFRLPEYSEFAVKNDYKDTLDINNEEGKNLIKEMLRQVILTHPESEYVHLGMDEATGLTKSAKENGCEVVEIFINYLLELIDFVSQYDKIPIIFTDMLEDYFAPGYIDKLRGRVVLNVWDYLSTGKYNKSARFRGWRTSNKWLNTPFRSNVPEISAKTRFFEDLPENLQNSLFKYRQDDEILSMFQVDLWSEKGFKVIGATSVRISADGALFPNYHHRAQNIKTFVDAINRNSQLGIIATSWARGTTFSPPNFPNDLTWPLLSYLAKVNGHNSEIFFKGINNDDLMNILFQLSKCKDEWSIEEKILDKLEKLTSKIKTHQYEWQSLVLMVQVFSEYRKIDFFLLETEIFYTNNRLPLKVWERIFDDYNRLLNGIIDLKQHIHKHFSQRYSGIHYQEWLDYIFNVRLDKMKYCKEIILSKRKEKIE